jgi:LacI family transcriptional regulator
MPMEREGQTRRVTSHDIARLANVSQATVSRVLTGKSGVAPERRDRVLWALEQTGYRRNAAATAMRTGRTRTAAVVVSDVRNPFYPELLATLGSELAAHDYRMILWETGAGEDHAAAAVREHLVDGLLFCTAMPGSPALAAARSAGVPVVLLNRTLPDAGVDQVSGDNHAAAATVAGHLLAAGHEHLALVTGPADASTSEERAEGFRSVVRAAGVRWLEVAGDFSHDTARTLGHELLRGQRHPSAVFCVNDLTAFGVLNAATACGRSVPQDVAVVGFDDIPMAAWERLALTTVRQPIAEMAHHAVQRLVARLEGDDSPPTHRRLPCTLVVRDSTGGASPIRDA